MAPGLLIAIILIWAVFTLKEVWAAPSGRKKKHFDIYGYNGIAINSFLPCLYAYWPMVKGKQQEGNRLMQYEVYRFKVLVVRFIIGLIGLIATIAVFIIGKSFLFIFAFSSFLVFFSEIILYRKYKNYFSDEEAFQRYIHMGIPMAYMLTIFALGLSIFFLFIS